MNKNKKNNKYSGAWKLLENYPDAACVLDNNLALIYSNSHGIFTTNKSLPDEIIKYVRENNRKKIETHEKTINIDSPKAQHHVKMARIDGKEKYTFLSVRDVTSERILEEKMYHRSEELSILYEISSLNNEPLHMENIVLQAVDKLSELTALEYSVFLEIDNMDPDKTFRVHNFGVPENVLQEIIGLYEMKNIPESLLSLKSHIWLKNNKMHSRLKEIMSLAGLGTIIKIPINIRGELTGIVFLLSKASSPLRIHNNVRFFDLLAGQLGATLDRSRLYTELEQSFQEIDKKNRIFSEQLELAQKLQTGILEIQFPQKPKIEFAVKYIPSYHLGGDFYDIFEIHNKIGVLIADVCGHGVSSALITTFLKAAARDLSQQLDAPAQLLNSLNSKLMPVLPEEMFISAFYMIVDLDNNKLLFSNGGHPLPFFYDASTDEVIELDIPGMLLSLSDKTIFQTKSRNFGPGDKVFLFTDGLYEIANQQGELLGVERIQETIFENRKLSVKNIVEKMMEVVYHHSGTMDLEDDLNLIGIDLL